MDDAVKWDNGELHSTLFEGGIVKYAGKVQILDPKFVKDRFDQYIQMVTTLAASQVGPQEGEPAVPPNKQGGRTQPGRKARSPEEVRAQRIIEKVAEFSGGISLEQVASLGEFVGAFTNNSITVRVVPFNDHPEYHFAGTLLSRSEYIQPEREALFGRYGTKLEDWTVVMQVARVPSESRPQLPNFGEPVTKGDVLSRGALESALGMLMDYMEALGIAEGARYPAVSVTVLAIYREFA